MGPQAHSDNGFATVELMAALLVLAVLIAIAIAVYNVSHGTGFRCATNPAAELVLLSAAQMVTSPLHP